MTSAYEYINRAAAEDWIKRWGATYWTLAGLLNLSIQPGSRENTETGHTESVIALLAQNDTIQSINKADPSDLCDSEADALRQIAEDVLSFSAQHFAFVLDTFHGGHIFQLSQERTSEPPFNEWHTRKLILAELGDNYLPSKTLADYALRRVLAGFNQDVLALHAIWTQNKTLDDTGTNTIRARRQANRTLAENVRRTFDKFLSGTTTPFVYLRSWAGTRLMPAGRSPLIGIPPSALLVPSESLAIPHEMGHFLFWRGSETLPPCDKLAETTLLRDKLDAKLAHLDSLRHSVKFDWREEIFADVVAALYGGPVVVDSLVRMMKEKVGPLAYTDTGRHPIPLVRPYALMHVIRQATAYKCVGEQMADEWTRWIKCEDFKSELGEDLCLELRPSGADKTSETVSLADLRQDVEQMAACIVEFFKEEDICPDTLAQRWTEPKIDEQDAQHAEDAITKLILTAESRQQADDPAFTYLYSWAQTVKAAFPTGTSGHELLTSQLLENAGWAVNILNFTGPEPSQNPEKQLTFDEWFSILALGGWGDGGASAGMPHAT